MFLTWQLFSGVRSVRVARGRSRRSPCWPLFLGCLACPGLAAAQEGAKGIAVDFMLNFYGQDGDRSPVTGGIGTEKLTVLGAIVDASWALSAAWRITGELGVDSITSASTDNMDLGELEMSGASRNDQRGFGRFGVLHTRGSHTLGASLGFSGEYDYTSVSGGLSWSVELNQKNTTLSARLNQYLDTVTLYDIRGLSGGSDSRSTTTLGLSVAQVLGSAAVGSLSFEYTRQSGFLSSSFQEVILAPEPGFPDGRHVAERLPDLRERFAAGAQLNVAFGPNVVQRSFYRLYDDTFGIRAHTLESETHFRLPMKGELWLFPILRYNTQSASNHFVLPRDATAADPYFTADGDLGGFVSKKLGLGLRKLLPPRGEGLLAGIRELEWRGVYTTREDGQHSISTSIGFHWGF